MLSLVVLEETTGRLRFYVNGWDILQL